MSYSIAVDDQQTLVVVKYAGTVTLEERARGVNESVVLLNSTGYRNVLVDLSASTVVFRSDEEQSNFATLLSGNEVLRECKTAYLTGHGGHSNDYIEMLAYIRHFKCRHFTDIEAAYQWFRCGE